MLKRKIVFTLGLVLVAVVIVGRFMIRWSLETASSPAFVNWLPGSFVDIVGIFSTIFDTLLLIISNVFLGSFSLVMHFWIFGIALTLIATVILIHISRRILYRKPQIFPIFLCAILVYILLLLTLSYREPKVESSLSMMNISKSIEKRQMGPFYTITKYFNLNEGDYGKYTLYANENRFILRQRKNQSDGANVFFVSPSDDIQHIDITKSDAQHSNLMPIEGRPDSVECIDKRDNFGLVSGSDCDTLLYKDHEIFSYPGWYGWLNGVALSANERWMIVHISFGPFDPEAVYLLDLRSLTEKGSL